MPENTAVYWAVYWAVLDEDGELLSAPSGYFISTSQDTVEREARHWLRYGETKYRVVKAKLTEIE